MICLLKDYIQQVQDSDIEPEVKTEKLQNANAILEYLVEKQQELGSSDIEIGVNIDEVNSKITEAQSALDQFKNSDGVVDLSVEGAQQAADNLDKDLLVQGNKVYSPETCVFLLHYQNTMFERSAKDKIYEKEDGTFVIGGGKKKTYATLKEAEDIVCERNQNRIESVAEKCKGSIPMCAYEAMLNWDVRLAMCG